MRAYERRQEVRRVFPRRPSDVTPGFRIEELIDQFYAEGVVPDFIQADLGYDDADEVDPATGWPRVDPDGRIDIDRMDRHEARLMSGVVDPDDPAPAPPTDPAE